MARLERASHGHGSRIVGVDAQNTRYSERGYCAEATRLSTTSPSTASSCQAAMTTASIFGGFSLMSDSFTRFLPVPRNSANTSHSTSSAPNTMNASATKKPIQ